MLYKEITEYCDVQFNLNDNSVRCPECQFECKKSCNQCLKNIHSGDSRGYNCKNMTNYYVCKFTHRYASEIYRILESNNNFKGKKRINVLSVGCGPASDLIGIEKFVEDYHSSCNINYLGIDMCDSWKGIHNQIKTVADKSMNIKFSYNDAFRLFKKRNLFSEESKVDLLIFQYVISDMVQKQSIGLGKSNIVEEFLDNLVTCIKVLPLPYTVIINDANHINFRKYYDLLLKKLNTEGFTGQYNEYHFRNERKNYFPYGQELPNNRIVFDSLYLSTPKQYDILDSCASASIVINLGG